MKLAVFINFQANREYIAENLCENKDEPESCCKGSCQLEKEMEAIEQAEDGTDNKQAFKQEKVPEKESKLKEKNLEQIVYSKRAGINKVVSTIRYRRTKQDSLLKSGYLFQVFRPPVPIS